MATVLAILCTPRLHGHTATLLKAAASGYWTNATFKAFVEGYIGGKGTLEAYRKVPED